MSRLQMNKSSLAQQHKDLATYKKYLPSLDLKRQQLMTERAKARACLKEMQIKQQKLIQWVKDELPMLANHDVNVNDLVTVKDVKLAQENVVGTRLPIIEFIHLHTQKYSLLAKPHWVDNAVQVISEGLQNALSIHVQQQRLTLLDRAVTTITQRVNLFEKVLIPKAEDNIKKIRIYLSDEQMTAVVRSKIAKRKRAGMAV
ncbi:V-type ATP synthase subunit D [Aestuariibacter salexigens]|uniref:V-type ATP synthase subunit D n=1 Tax=Aestuariibacter salexigens TaxID=226010 RepID=UPI0004081CC2|nr:V-type ATP synthase subunit D [Aestuariibacter salexigens]